jgi:hypothetical protein
MVRYDYIIGIDPGVTTGLSVWDGDRLLVVESSTILEAIERVKMWNDGGAKIFIRLEDARKRKWFGKSSREVLQGAGSIKRDCKIWEDFLTEQKIEFELVAPKNNKTKVAARFFNRLTGWKASTNEHSRDAAMLVYKFNCNRVVSNKEHFKKIS